MVNLELVKLHARIEDDYEDGALTRMIKAATSHVTRITKVENDANSPEEYDLACLLLISHWYQNREAVVEGSRVKLPYGVNMLIQNLKYSQV